MPRASTLPDYQLLVSFSEAGKILGVGRDKVLSLIYQGVLKPHPIISDRIYRKQLDDFVQLGYVQTPRREMDESPAPETWDTPPLRLRENT